MRKGDLVWCAALAAVLALLAAPATHEPIVAATKAHPYAMGFAKFAILATMGELLSIRLVRGAWTAPAGPVWRAVVWGLLGAVLAVVFPVFSSGIAGAIKAGLLPVASGPTGEWFCTALWVSVVMNLTWAPGLMLYHRITDTYLDLAGGRLSRVGSVRLADVAQAIDWRGFLGFVVFRTIPFFWIPAHTITFLFPPELRVLVAAFLSLALGALLAFAKVRGAAKAGAHGRTAA